MNKITQTNFAQDARTGAGTSMGSGFGDRLATRAIKGVLKRLSCLFLGEVQYA